MSVKTLKAANANTLNVTDAKSNATSTQTPPTQTIPSETNSTTPPKVIVPLVQNHTIVEIKTEEGDFVQVEEKENYALVVSVICSILGAIIIGAVTAFFVYRRIKLHKTMKELQQVDLTSRSSISNQSPSQMKGDDEDNLEEQYHPQFDIFTRKTLKIQGKVEDYVFEEEFKGVDSNADIEGQPQNTQLRSESSKLYGDEVLNEKQQWDSTEQQMRVQVKGELQTNKVLPTFSQ